MNKIFSACATIFFLSLCMLFLSLFSLTNQSSFAQQQQELTDADTTTPEQQAVTSTNDAIIKSVLIISQVSVMGITFNNMIFQIISKKNINHKTIHKESKKDYIYDDISFEKRFTKILLLSSLFIIFASTGTILLQAYELSQQIQLDMSTAFSIILSTSVGQVWTVRIITALLVIGLGIIYYILKNNAFKNIQNQKSNKKIAKLNTITIPIILLTVILIVSSVNLFSNSMVSHSNALKSFSSFAVSMDWLHFVAVSIWIGGLFYISTIMFKRNKTALTDNNGNTTISSNTNYEYRIENNIKNTYQISILLTYFSFIAIVCLSVIGLTGLYLALIHLQNLSSIFNTLYGNILIIKLSLAFPMILIGRYNQNKIQDYIKLTKNIATGNNSNINQDSNVFKKDNKKRTDDLINGIKKSIKIESLIGISVLIAASFLSITSPPSLATSSTTNHSINESNTGANISINTNNMDFPILIIILSIIIVIIGLLNFRKNQQKVKDIYVPNQNDESS